MTLTRRKLLESALLAAAAAGAGRTLACAAFSPVPDVRVYDSEVPLSRAWLCDHADRGVDVALERASRWTRLRSLAPSGRVAGLTTWSDYVQARGLLQEKGKRLRVELRSANLFYWEMV